MFIMTALATFTTPDNKQVKTVFTSCKWNLTIDNYCNTAEIVLPSKCTLRAHDYKGSEAEEVKSVATNMVLQKGSFVKLECGYNGERKLRFSGFVVASNVKDFKLIISCEGFSYQLRHKQFTKSYRSPKLKELLNDLIVGTSIKLSKHIPDIQLTGNIVFPKGKRGIDVLEYLKDKCGLTVYFNHDELYVGLKFIQIGNEVKFKMGWNVIDADALVYKEATNDYSITIETSRKQDGSRNHISSGKGTEIKLKVQNLHDEGFLKQLAKDKLLEKNPGSYSGSFTTFLEPFVQPFDTAILYDSKYPDREGKYFISSVKGSFSTQGGRQEVGITIKLN